jgi:hypothetical protein
MRKLSLEELDELSKIKKQQGHFSSDILFILMYSVNSMLPNQSI